MKFTTYVTASALLGLMLTGCATPTKMWTGQGVGVQPMPKEPVYLMTATFKNNYHPSYQPKLLVAHIEEPNAANKSQRLNFVMDAVAKDEQDTREYGNRYFLRLPIPQKDYVLKGFSGFSGVFPVRGMFFAPMDSALKPHAPGYYYLGHISAVVRERQGDELRAGPVIPLLDQAVTGFSGGTFDIDVSDRLDQDLPLLISKFPALKDAQIQKELLQYVKPSASSSVAGQPK